MGPGAGQRVPGRDTDAWSIKTKPDKLGLITVRNLCSVHEPVEKDGKTGRRLGETVCKPPIWWRTAEESRKTPKTQHYKPSNQKMGERHGQTFAEMAAQRANKHTKRCSASLAIWKMRWKPQWSINTHLSEWLKETKTVITPNAGEGAERTARPHTADGSIQRCSPSAEDYGSFS